MSSFYSNLANAADGLELLIPTEYIQMEENSFGLQLQRPSSHGIKLIVKTIVVSCIYWQPKVEQWTNFGCWVTRYAFLTTSMCLNVTVLLGFV